MENLLPCDDHAHPLTHEQVERILDSWVHLGTATTVRRPLKIDAVVSRIITDLDSKALVIDEIRAAGIIRFLGGHYPHLQAALLANRTSDQASRILNLAREDRVDLRFPPAIPVEIPKFEPRGT